VPRPDPRVDPDSVPPSSAATSSVVERSVERVVVSKLTAKEASEGAASAPVPAPVTSEDPRITEIEPLVKGNDWRGVARVLGELDATGKLPPNLGLVAAVAHNETSKDANDDARALAIRCTASLLGMKEDSEVVRVLARRLLRKNPASELRLRERPAPPAKTSALIVLAMLVVGGGLGWFLSSPWFARVLHALRL